MRDNELRKRAEEKLNLYRKYTETEIKNAEKKVTQIQIFEIEVMKKKMLSNNLGGRILERMRTKKRLDAHARSHRYGCVLR